MSGLAVGMGSKDLVNERTFQAGARGVALTAVLMVAGGQGNLAKIGVLAPVPEVVAGVVTRGSCLAAAAWRRMVVGLASAKRCDDHCLQVRQGMTVLKIASDA